MTESAAAEAIVFHRPKAGSTGTEWEDRAGFDGGDHRTGRPARYVVVDGATEAYDAERWVGQLVDSFLGDECGDEPPELTADGIARWVVAMQRQWVEQAPARFAGVIEEQKFRTVGSFATFLGCEVYGLGGPQPQWVAASIGDTVLFHVRDDRVVAQHPPIAAGEFGTTPAGLSTQDSERGRMQANLHFDRGDDLRVGDRLYVATDALAEWLVRRDADIGGRCWREFDELQHPADFARTIARERNSGNLKNDDVTLLRVQITPHEADVMVVCR